MMDVITTDSNRHTVIPGQHGFVVVRDGNIIMPKTWDRVVAGPFSTAKAANKARDLLSRPPRP